MSGIEALGDAATGTMLAGAVEPHTGAVADGHTHEANCLNCGAQLAGDYCHDCGQRAHVHRSLRGFCQDMVQGLFNFEGKIWRTLPMLAWRPGELTRRYIAGQRARFVSPIALYLFSVFLMFAVLNLPGALGSDGPKVADSNLKLAVREQQSAIAKLERERAAKLAAGAPVGAVDLRIASEKSDLAQLEKVRRGDFSSKVMVDDDSPTWVRELIGKAQQNPELVIFKVQDAASKFSWLLIPLSVPFLWLLFPFRRDYKIYDHTVFVTYSLSFMMMLVVSGGLLVALGAPSVASMLFFVPPIHFYRQLRGAYELSRWSAIWRTLVLMLCAFVALTVFMIVLVALGMFG